MVKNDELKVKMGVIIDRHLKWNTYYYELKLLRFLSCTKITMIQNLFLSIQVTSVVLGLCNCLKHSFKIDYTYLAWLRLPH